MSASTGPDLRSAVSEQAHQGQALLKARVLGEDDPNLPAGTSRALSEQDVFDAVAASIVQPPYDPTILQRVVEQSSELGQLIDAMETNIEGFGHRLVAMAMQRQPSRNAPEEEQAVHRAATIAALEERVRLQNFFRTCTTEHSFVAWRRALRKDLEGGGNAYFELVRNSKGQLVGLRHLPAYQMRMSYQDRDLVEAVTRHLVAQQDGSFGLEERMEYRRFRKFVQGQTFASGGGGAVGKLRWFKELGDPRVVDCNTGLVVPAAQVANYGGSGKPMPLARQAGEVFHLRINATRSPYGMPRYIGNILAALGSRQAEEVNYNTLNNNNVPSMIVAVSNGQLTGSTIDRMEQFVRTQVQGSQNRSKFLILEAEQAYEGEQTGQVKVDITPLANVQINDAMFQNYLKSNTAALRRSFRLPPIFVGAVDDYSRNVAEASRALADEQVFAPERNEFDWLINTKILPELGCVYHRFESRTPNITDNSELIAMLASAERSGGVTPRLARMIVEDVFGGAAELPPVGGNGDFDPDIPFSLTMAERIKNQSDPTEINQQGPPTQMAIEQQKALQKAYADAVASELMDIGGKAAQELARMVAHNRRAGRDD